MYLIRAAGDGDLPAVASLLEAYMRETYASPWHGTVEGLRRDGLGARLRLLVAQFAGEAVGFLAWERAYDLHHCLTGGHVLDLYVSPGHRVRGVAVQLVAHAAGIVHGEGGAFIKGGAVSGGTASRLYGRFAPAYGNDYILGGRAFRHLAAQSGLAARALARSMPRREWNFEP